MMLKECYKDCVCKAILRFDGDCGGEGWCGVARRGGSEDVGAIVGEPPGGEVGWEGVGTSLSGVRIWVLIARLQSHSGTPLFPPSLDAREQPYQSLPPSQPDRQRTLPTFSIPSPALFRVSHPWSYITKYIRICIHIPIPIPILRISRGSVPLTQYPTVEIFTAVVLLSSTWSTGR